MELPGATSKPLVCALVLNNPDCSTAQPQLNSGAQWWIWEAALAALVVDLGDRDLVDLQIPQPSVVVSTTTAVDDKQVAIAWIDCSALNVSKHAMLEHDLRLSGNAEGLGLGPTDQLFRKQTPKTDIFSKKLGSRRSRSTIMFATTLAVHRIIKDETLMLRMHGRGRFQDNRPMIQRRETLWVQGGDMFQLRKCTESYRPATEFVGSGCKASCLSRTLV
jgi:hypothetical protein